MKYAYVTASDRAATFTACIVLWALAGYSWIANKKRLL